MSDPRYPVGPFAWAGALTASGRQQCIGELIAHYAWHGRHHTAHITALRQHRGW